MREEKEKEKKYSHDIFIDIKYALSPILPFFLFAKMQSVYADRTIFIKDFLKNAIN